MSKSATYAKARRSRDARFDGVFFIAVKTTGIYCRPICPAPSPHEHNVTYYDSAEQAAAAGFRPCLRCRPDSAPGSPAWRGVHRTLDRALRLINDGHLSRASVADLAEYLGVSDRHLRQLFQRHLGVSVKQFALHRQCLFAKKLLQQTSLPISQVALASGFRSLRRFNDCFSQQLRMTPSRLRRSEGSVPAEGLQVQLSYRPPFDWSALHAHLQHRLIDGMEWLGESHWGRSFCLRGHRGHFTARHVPGKHQFLVHIAVDDWRALQPATHAIRRMLDLDLDAQRVESDLARLLGRENMRPGLRLPGLWGPFEAGVRAILGQQVSVKAATALTTQLVHALGATHQGRLHFPEAEVMAEHDLAFLRMPDARRQSLRALARHWMACGDDAEPRWSDWLNIKGIGPWTVDYARMRGCSDTDVWLGGDLGVQKALRQLPPFDPQEAAPWRSYLTLQLWQLT